jgi:ketosteroid isomerase-like protein
VKLPLFLLLLVTLSPAAHSDTRFEQAESTVLALENAWNQAVRLRESGALQLLLVDGLIYIEYDGRMMSKAQYLAQVRAPQLHPEHIVSESMRAHSYGNSVIVTGVYREKGTKNGAPYVLRERFIDTWIRQNGVWACVSSQSTLIANQ